MLYITTKDGKEIVWHVGDLKSAAELRRTWVQHVEEIQADGDELDRIRSQFPELTPKLRRVARFYGDLARTILWNILY